MSEMLLKFNTCFAQNNFSLSGTFECPATVSLAASFGNSMRQVWRSGKSRATVGTILYNVRPKTTTSPLKDDLIM